MGSKVFRKTADEIETFGIDYSDRLSNAIFQNDTIDTTSWTVPDGITKDSDTKDKQNTRTTIMVSGGTSGDRYTLTNLVTTVGGRTLEEDIVIVVD